MQLEDGFTCSFSSVVFDVIKIRKRFQLLPLKVRGPTCLLLYLCTKAVAVLVFAILEWHVSLNVSEEPADGVWL